MLNLNVYSIEGFQELYKIGYLYHPDGPSDYVKNNLACSTLASIISSDLFLRYSNLIVQQPNNGYCPNYNNRFQKYQEKYITKQNNTLTNTDYSDWQSFVVALNGGATIQVGNDSWQPNKGYDVYWIDEATAKNDPSMYFENDYYWKVMVIDGKLIAILAPSSWLSTQLSWPKVSSREGTFRGIILFPLEAVLRTLELSKDTDYFCNQDYSGPAGSPMSINGQSITTEFIAFTPNP